MKKLAFILDKHGINDNFERNRGTKTLLWNREHKKFIFGEHEHKPFYFRETGPFFRAQLN